ncbi:Multidrug resistance protein 1 [Allomyces arbusculus]|nr:Multidrug resistance protein 1 [Allomyces arbusculus]
MTANDAAGAAARDVELHEAQKNKDYDELSVTANDKDAVAAVTTTDNDADKKAPDTQLVPFMGLFRYADGKDKLHMALGLVCAAAFGSGMPLMTVVFGDIIQAFNDYASKLMIPGTTPAEMAAAKDALEHDVIRSIIWFIVIGVAAFFAAWGQQAFWMVAGENQAKRIRKLFVDKVLHQEIAFFDKHPAGDLTTRLTGDISLIQDGISEKVSMTFQYAATFIAAFVIAFTKGWQLTLVLLAVTPLLGAAGAVMGKIMGAATERSQATYGEAGSIAQEVLSSIRTVVAFGGEERSLKAYEIKLRAGYVLNVKKAVYAGIGIGVFMLILFCTYSLGFYFGSIMVKDGKMKGGDVLNVFFAVIIGAFSLGQAGPNMQTIATGRGAAAKIYDIIERVPSINSASENGQKVDSLKGSIEFRNVSFHYPSRPDVPILKNFNLTVNPGETVALVGESGSGKSTIVQQLLRFYDPVEGEVLVDGVNVRDYHLKSYRTCIGFVQQEPVLFDVTIAENVAMGAKEGVNVTRDMIEAACKLSNASGFISKLPQGLDTRVGERGSLLSGGQKQRVAIARAIISSPSLLLLDEATSALDTESEKIVQEALDKASNGRTTIVVAHRLSTIQSADKIVVMKKGVIVEMGTHESLIAANGYYASLVHAQEVRTDGNTSDETTADPDVVLAEGVHDAHGNKNTYISLERTKSNAGDTIASIAEVKDDDDENVEAPPVNMMRLFALQKPEALLLFGGTLGGAINGVIMPLFSVVFSKILSVFAETDINVMRDRANFWAGMFVVLAIVSFIANFMQAALFGIAGERLTMRVRAMSLRALLRQNIAFFDQKENSTGALTHQLSDEADRIQGLTGAYMGSIVQLATNAIAGLVIAFIYSWKLTLIILACAPVMVIAGALQMKVMAGSGGKIKKAYGAAAHLTCDAMANIRTVQSLAREKWFLVKYGEQIEVPHKISMRKAWLGSMGFGFSQGSIFLVYSAAYYAGFRLVFDDGLDVGDMFICMFSVVFAAMGAGQMSAFGPNAAKAKIATASFFQLLDRVPPIDVTSDSGERRVNSEVQGAVKLDNVKFSYPSRPDAPILRGMNANLPAGKKIALCGASGGGKSTIIAALERWYDVNSGTVSLDGLDVKDWHLPNLRSHLSLVAQEPVLFSMTIGENIAYSKPDATMDEIIRAAKLANIHNFVDSLPDKYDTPITGAQVSGGQRQRIAIARAIIRDPKVLLLDEATSALDSESEKVVQAALDKVSEGRTSIIVAHRLSTIQDADLILCMRDGRVVEQGTHDELYAQRGLYYTLVNNQKLTS